MAERRRCSAQTLTGEPCKQHVKEGQERCWQHGGAQCSVCLTHMGGQSATRKLGCGHEFHDRCLNRWKLQCTDTPTCPLCRVPFDVPKYKCRLIIERSSDSARNTNDFETVNIASLVAGFGLQLRELAPAQGLFMADIHFDIDPDEILHDVLSELGLPTPPPNF